MASIWSDKRKTGSRPSGSTDLRTPFEQDLDRLLFSTPVRRLADKTQVFPLERNDSVRTRLTHSHEVSNLAKSIGTRLIRTDPRVFGDTDEIRAAAPVILAAVGLAHDLGNPPFGHRGEAEIGRWFVNHSRLFENQHQDPEKASDPKFAKVPDRQRRDFTKFEGNAQSLRLVARLQNTAGPAGLNLTAATLAALMKYPVASYETDESRAATKKYGYFDSEKDVVEWIREETGLGTGQRHPLTWIMEASDDIAYSVLDIEDAIKKGLVSAEDLLAYLRREFRVENLGGLINQLSDDFSTADKAVFSLSRVREIKATYLRTRLIERLISGAANTFLQHREEVFSHSWSKSLLDCGSDESRLYAALKDFAKVHAYQSPNVLDLEYKGSIIISGLMDEMWEAIAERKDFSKRSSRRVTAKSGYIYSLISDSYRWHFEHDKSDWLSTRYCELQLLADMISGMTDGFALDLHERIFRHGRC